MPEREDLEVQSRRAQLNQRTAYGVFSSTHEVRASLPRCLDWL
jgi:hypothetical protein